MGSVPYAPEHKSITHSPMGEFEDGRRTEAMQRELESASENPRYQFGLAYTLTVAARSTQIVSGVVEAI